MSSLIPTIDIALYLIMLPLFVECARVLYSMSDKRGELDQRAGVNNKEEGAWVLCVLFGPYRLPPRPWFILGVYFAPTF